MQDETLRQRNDRLGSLHCCLMYRTVVLPDHLTPCRLNLCRSQCPNQQGWVSKGVHSTQDGLALHCTHPVLLHRVGSEVDHCVQLLLSPGPLARQSLGHTGEENVQRPKVVVRT